ncbi:hypothetical protein CEXT_605471 [Caerostris extrusa]|uniref:Uncharacterized protein n=1 Tax=Caerostris extrusa TaxID=172846 RepID=A0AAV4VGH9_CAEEX|nr:hypothetical protein CEXT_605471 [Caerostris extrusa]
MRPGSSGRNWWSRAHSLRKSKTHAVMNLTIVKRDTSLSASKIGSRTERKRSPIQSHNEEVKKVNNERRWTFGVDRRGCDRALSSG